MTGGESRQGLADRVVETSNGLIRLEISALLGGLAVHVRRIDKDGWGTGERCSFQEGLKVGKHHEHGYRSSLAEAIGEVAGLSTNEAEAIATETLAGWQEHVWLEGSSGRPSWWRRSRCWSLALSCCWRSFS